MKKVQKVLTLLLVFMMVFTTAGMNVAAAGEMDSVAGEADIQSQEQQQTLDETDTQQETTQQPLEGILEYVYVDEMCIRDRTTLDQLEITNAVSIDLQDCKSTGEYEVPVSIEVPDGVELEKQPTIKVKLTEKEDETDQKADKKSDSTQEKSEK